MRVPTRKPGKYTGIKPDPKITAEKYAELKENLYRLKKHVQPKLAAEVHRLALMGDFSENAAYQIAKGRLRGINQRILDIEDHLKRAEIIKTPQNRGVVEVGLKVTVLVNGKEKTYLILGSSETDPSAGVISRNSPLGSALLGRKVGETVKVYLAQKEVEYKIIKVAS
jgi:transcription elongation factor GreA